MLFLKFYINYYNYLLKLIAIRLNKKKNNKTTNNLIFYNSKGQNILA